MSKEIIVRVDGDLEDIVPEYLEGKKSEVEKMRSALEGGELETIRAIAHDMKGTGAGYGLDILTEIGSALESAAKDGNKDGAGSEIERLADFLENVTVFYY